MLIPSSPCKLVHLLHLLQQFRETLVCLYTVPIYSELVNILFRYQVIFQ